MALLGQAAVAMWWDIAPEMRDEFLDWHTHEHHPERMGIEGFRRGSRWASASEATGFFVMYELAERATLLGPAYLERLNNPTPWSARMMPHHLGMVRVLADVVCSAGAGIARCVLTVRLSPLAEKEQTLRQHLSELLPRLAQQRGVSGAHLLEAAPVKSDAMTQEQRIRGGDATADWVVLLVGYGAPALQALRDGELSPAKLEAHGAKPGAITGLYELSGTLSAGERDSSPAS
jgi:hypothetical protein